MDTHLAIRVNNLGKRYQLGHVVSFKRTLRETLTALPKLFKDRTKTILHPTDPTPEGSNGPEHFWALKSINFEVKPTTVTKACLMSKVLVEWLT